MRGAAIHTRQFRDQEEQGRQARGQPRAGQQIDATALAGFVKAQIGSVKTPKQIEVWDDLPRSKVGKVLKPDIRARLAERSGS